MHFFTRRVMRQVLGGITVNKYKHKIIKFVRIQKRKGYYGEVMNTWTSNKQKKT